MRKSHLNIILLVFFLLVQKITAQHTLILKNEEVQKGDTCTLYGYKNAMPLLLKTAIAEESGKIVVKDTSNTAKEGVYVFRMPKALNNNPVTILYSEEEKRDIELHYYGHNQNIVFKDSEQNNAYVSFMQSAKQFYGRQHFLEEEFLNTFDSIERKKIRNKVIAEQQILYDYGMRIANAYKGSVLARLVACNNTLPIPDMAWSAEHLIYKIEEKEYQNAIKFIRQHYWEGVDFNDNMLLNTPYLYGKTGQYMSLFHIKDTTNSKEAINDLLTKASVNPDAYHVIQEALLNMYLIKQSDFFNEEIGIYILQNERNQAFTPDWRKDIINSRISYIKKNSIGSLAADLPLKDQKGIKQSLRNIKSKYTVLYFFDPDCSRCMQVTPVVKEWLSNTAPKDITILGIYVNNDKAEWNKYINENSFPKNWINVWGDSDFVKIRTDYWLDNIPSIYLLDENKKVLLKDVNYKQLINHFNEQ
ncbi:thioredoxin-like domain-containing protein [Flavobacterium sp. CFBP9031]|uniref:thioredoxin-like domain-containing protein n=1 Tax=Flavobacterium sp. CFBP9031 TaxID=3096538 RepID=UPI002A69FD49|nr:thioredoxin-like domain-containing protein [Flavobacterium sp. CFBP9031]MDY0990509.1 thioredoxin-like domain-containing protein [Flavobacterium sp. CFBP9031]